MDPATGWDALARPWRDAAAQHGFRLLDSTLERIPGGHRCVDHLLSGSTFLDLAGQLGDAQGVWLATAVTWLDSAESRFSLWTMGEVDPPPRPRGAAGWLAAHLVRKLMRKLAPQAAPVPMRTAEDLALVIRKHTSELMASGAKPVLFEGDPLQARFAQQEHDER